MKDFIIRQLAERASVPGKQQTWISTDLSDEQRYQLFLRLRNGESARAIAAHIQKAWGVLPDSSVHSIAQGITKFKKRIATLLLPHTSIIAPIDTKAIPSELPEGVDGMEIVQRLYQQRVFEMMQEERETGVNYPHLSRDVQALSNLTKALNKQKEWELIHDSPLKAQQIRRKQERLVKYFHEVVDPMSAEERENYGKALRRTLELAEKEAYTVHWEGGKPVLKKSGET